MLFSDIFQPNLAVKCIFYCLTVVQNFILKSAHNDEISTKVTRAVVYVQTVHLNFKIVM